MRVSAWYRRIRFTRPRTGAAGWLFLLALASVLAGAATPGRAQSNMTAVPTATPIPAATPQPHGFFLFRAPQRSIAQQLAPGQKGPFIAKDVYDAANEGNTHVVVSLSRQRVFLYNGDQVAIDSPISSGKQGHTTPSGHLHILAKEPSHFSNIYGAFCDRNNRIVRSGVSSVIDSAPAGTHFVGAPMKWFMRLTEQGVGMHVGILPGYAASHGCVRLPAEIAPLIYQKVRVGTPVTVGE